MDSPGASRPRPALLRAAVGRDGFHYRLKKRASLRLGRAADFHPTPAIIDDKVHVYLSAKPAQNSSESIHRAVFDARSGFKLLDRLRIPDIQFVGTILPETKGLRAYVGSDEGVRSAMSKDGTSWTVEPGLGLGEGREPAVVRLRDGSYLMLYTTPLDQEAASTPLVSTATIEERNTGATTGDRQHDAAEDGPDANDAMDELAILADQELDDLEEALEPDDDTVVVQNLPGEPGDDPELEVNDDGIFAPPPDFATHTDYFEWYRVSALDQTADNAYYAYAAFMPDPCDELGSKPPLPECPNMLHDDDYTGSPGPWAPEDHPTWEACHQEMQETLGKFHEATLHEGYAYPMTPAPPTVESLPDGERLLVSLMLPQLGPHRVLAKATLADAWRIENGRVSSDRMIQAWETVLRGAAHMERGVTLIEDLVANAERNLVEESARLALKEGIFAPEELEHALDTLRKFDRVQQDLGQTIRGEHAAAADLTQYLFSPPTAEGLPQPNPVRIKAVAKELFNKPELADRLMQMTPEDVQDSLGAFDSYYREIGEQIATGYPNVRAKDLDESFERIYRTSPLTEEMIPGLSRYHHLQARNEASRRATQLAYETHVFRARQGRWPASLDELPDEAGRNSRTDPFTGTDFGYRLTDDGPRIYSRSENGVDDGGVHSTRWGDGQPQGTNTQPQSTNGQRQSTNGQRPSDDFVFWPPVPRE